MKRTILAVLIAVAATTAGLQAQDEVERQLARALVLEETEGDPGRAAAVYAEIRANAEHAADLRFRAGLGLARCRRLGGDVAGARALLDELAASAAEGSIQRAAVDEERARLEGAVPQDPDALREKILETLNRGGYEEVARMGRAAENVLVRILQTPIDGGSPSNLDHAVVRAFMSMKGEEIPLRLARIVTEGTSARVQSIVLNLPDWMRENPGRWDVVVRAAARVADAPTRRAAVEAVRLMVSDSDPAEVWERLLTDESVEVRARASKVYLDEWSGSTEEAYFTAFERAAKDPAVEIRRELGRYFRTAKTRGYEETFALVETLVADPDPNTRLTALSGANSVFPRMRTKPLLLAALVDEAPDMREFALGALRNRIDAGDIPIVRPLLSDPRDAIGSRAAEALKTQPAAAICDSPAAERLLLDCLKDRQGARRFAASVLARAGSRDVAEAMTSLFRDQYGDTRTAAVYYMVRTDNLAALPAALEVISEFSSVPDMSLSYVPPHFRPCAEVESKNPQEAILAWIANRGYTDALWPVLDRAAEFSQRNVSDLASVCRRLGKDRKEDVFRRVVAIQDISWRNLLLGELGAFFGAAPYALEFYIEGLSDLAEEVREASALALTRHGSAEAVPALIATIERETSKRVAEWLMAAVAKHARKRHVEEIGTALERATDETVQSILVQTLGRLGTKEALDILLARLEDASVARSAIIRHLGEHKVESAGPIIRRKLAADEFSRTDERIAAIRALGSLGSPEDIPILLDAMRKHDDTVRDGRHDFNLAGLASTIDERRRAGYHPAALLGIFDMGPDAYLGELPAILADEELGRRRASAVELLAFIDDRRADALIIASLGHSDARIRKAAARAAGHGLLVEAKGKLRALLRDTSVEVRTEANRALRRFVEFWAN